MNGQGNEADQGKHHSSRPLALPKVTSELGFCSVSHEWKFSEYWGSFSTVSTVTPFPYNEPFIIMATWGQHIGCLGVMPGSKVRPGLESHIQHLLPGWTWTGLLTSPTSIYSTETLRIYYYLHVLIRIEWVYRWKILYLAKIKNSRYCCIYMRVHKTVNIINGFLWFYSQVKSYEKYCQLNLGYT